MLLKQVADFIEYISARDRTLDEILAHVVLRVLTPLDASSCVISELNSEGRVIHLAKFGISQEEYVEYLEGINIRDIHPTTVSIREKKIVLINTLPEVPREFGLLKSIPHPSGSKSMITVPVENAGSPVAGLMFFSDNVIEMSEEIEAFLEAIAKIIALYMYRDAKNTKRQVLQSNSRESEVSVTARGEITDRQKLILQMMSEGRTNASISELLGYSESTIRQDTIKIFAFLGCSGRKEAAAIYRERYEKSA